MGALQLTGWGDYGLMGLISGAFVWLVTSALKTNRKQSQEHTELVGKLLEDSRSERKETRDLHCATTDRLACAVDKLAESLNNKRHEPGG